ncbi:MAG: hypothetical protein IPJ46_08970 [Anaerolineales bacterium]|nr:hypothetical protein [Anaerolineales bacterium]
MKKVLFTLLVCAILISACDTWGAPPQPFPVWTPIPTRTPGVVTATPLILLPPVFPTTITESPMPDSSVTTPLTATPSETETPSLTFSPAPSITASDTSTPAPLLSVKVDILGCNTSIDITHGMGEVTNAYITVKNNGTIDLPNTCSLLRAIDEDREHPDKQVCVENLPAQNQVTLKLTVDSAYKQNTLIQVDTTSNDVLLLRADKPSCTDIGLFGGAPSDVGIIKPIQP